MTEASIVGPDVKESVSLFYREGTSDKVYLAAVKMVPDGYVVDFAYGRRGQALQTGRKTSTPVPMDKAMKIYAKLVAEKTGKGYVADSKGIPFATADNARTDSGLRCQLLNPIDRETIEALILDDEWWMQEKHDGVRGLAKIENGTVDGVNRKGLVISLAPAIAAAHAELAEEHVFDGELVGDEHRVFDVLSLAGLDLREAPLSERLALLEACLADAKGPVKATVTARTAEEKRALLELVEKNGGEGVVAKRRSSRYAAGRPASGGDQLKFKLWETATVRVASINDQRSVLVELLDGTEWIPAGNVTIPSNKDVPVPGTLVEVRYLYAFRESGALYQPTYLGVREDLDEDSAGVAQLKYKTVA
jgi:bifunctional non-homologous end joining protein LigD